MRSRTRRLSRVAELVACLSAAGVVLADVPVPVSDDEAALIAACRRAAESTEQAAVAGSNNWIFLTSELRHVGAGKFWGAEARTASRAPREDSRDPLPVILDTHRQLKDLGIELLLVPVPPRAVVYADHVPGGPRAPAAPARRDPYHRAFYDLLRKEGVGVLDLTDLFLAERTRDAELGPVCCMQDTHWSPRGCELAAREIRRAVDGRPWLAAGGPPRPFRVTAETRTISGDLWILLGRSDTPREDVTWRVVRDADGAVPESDPGSPVLLLADSHGLVFHAGEDMHAAGAGLPDHLAMAFGFGIDAYLRRGSAATSLRVDLARRFRADDTYRGSKRLAIWCFAAREFTEAGWSMLQLVGTAR